MKQKEIAVMVKQKFATPDGKLVDVIYGTSDGQLFFDPELAKDAGATLGDPVITPYYRDSEVREAAKKYHELEKMVFATDYLKRHRLKKTPPVYQAYVEYADSMGMDYIKEDVFNFVMSKVFASTRPVVAGQKGQIYTYANGIVDAIFMRRYPQGQIWQVGDTLVLTCPTNTELMSGTYYTIFQPLLGEAR